MQSGLGGDQLLWAVSAVFCAAAKRDAGRLADWQAGRELNTDREEGQRVQERLLRGLQHQQRVHTHLAM
jgi:hypothetical protein